MSAQTSIEWTDRTWNPVTGCTKVSPGCAHCYAEGVADRFWATQYPKVPDEGHGIRGAVNQFRTREFTDVQAHEDRLLEPLSWRKPSKVFVNSMSDLFHEDVPDEFIDQVFAVMAHASRHVFQILTKRPERMRAYFAARTAADAGVTMKTSHRSQCGASSVVTRRDLHDGHSTVRTLASIDANYTGPLPNVWLGVSVENQHFADERIPSLLETPAAVRFISAEPLLGPIDLHSPVLEADCDGYLDWVIVGGESGAGARPFDLAWARDIVSQCKAAGVPVFYKQGGASNRCDHSSKGGCLECAPPELRVREFPRAL